MSKDRVDLFVKEYLLDHNATQAAIRAGYSEKTAGVTGCKLLKNANIAARIQSEMDARAKRTEITLDRVIRELGRLAFSDARKVVKWGASGVTPIGSDSLSDDDAACVSEVSQTVTEGGGSIKVKLHSKIDALKELRAHLRVNDETGDEICGPVVIRGNKKEDDAARVADRSGSDSGAGEGERKP